MEKKYKHVLFWYCDGWHDFGERWGDETENFPNFPLVGEHAIILSIFVLIA